MQATASISSTETSHPPANGHGMLLSSTKDRKCVAEFLSLLSGSSQPHIAHMRSSMSDQLHHK